MNTRTLYAICAKVVKTLIKILSFFVLFMIIGCSSNDVGLGNVHEDDINQNEVHSKEVLNEEIHSEEAQSEEVQKEEVQNNEIQDKLQNDELNDPNENIGYINIEDLRLNDLYLKMPYTDLTNIVGTELEKTVESDLGDDGIMYKLTFADETIVYLIDDEIYSVEVTSKDYQTPRGLKIGDTKDKVVELYNYPAYQDDNNWGFSTTNDYILFTLEFNNNKVSKIGINLVM